MKANAKNTDTNQLTSIQKKRQVNLRWNHTRNFQLGLILSILFVIIVVESVRVEIKEVPITITEDPQEELYLINDFRIEQPKPEAQPVAKAEPIRRVTELIKVVDNSFSTNAQPVIETDTPVVEIDAGVRIVPVKAKKDTPAEAVALNSVMQIPVFPGCDPNMDRIDQIDCFTQKVHKFVIRKFDYDIGAKENLSGRVRIYCQFTVSGNGDIVDIKTRTTNKALKQEAMKVISQLPVMKPGKEKGKSVPVIFSLPVIFEVQD